jgi:preprotein translocase subunit SecE
MAKAAMALENDQSLGGRMKQFPSRTRGFFSDVRNEVRKVTFPNMKEVRATTIVVIITVFVFAFYFWLIDLGLTPAMQWVLNHATR